MATPARITMATLRAHDMGAMRAFYRGLGWPEEADSDGFASFPTGGRDPGVVSVRAAPRASPTHLRRRPGGRTHAR